MSPEGDKIIIALHSKEGTPQEITLSFDEASALAMTLPRLLTMAMSKRFSDPSLRHVYPVHDYTVECASDQRHVLLTLSCGGGFDIVFGIDVNMVTPLARDLVGGQALLETPPSLRPN
ncbi:MAG: hypothetical protein DI595_01205 [Agrobacterium fabrum]|uniref:Uncharacterized protein n=1 Tax=Agrobacterium fabrum TaxID=1176649 RepID=A0A2W5FGE5_9HYPH|nr:MAG: hypothetical protein DI595_01205 [Agrobacterium fabrum]